MGVVCSSRCPPDCLSSGLAALLLTLLLVLDGYGLAVALIAWYWDVHLCNGRVAITGEISLSGHLSAVLGLREKALGRPHATSSPAPALTPTARRSRGSAASSSLLTTALMAS